jgi:hypothetical protein
LQTISCLLWSKFNTFPYPESVAIKLRTIIFIHTIAHQPMLKYNPPGIPYNAMDYHSLE